MNGGAVSAFVGERLTQIKVVGVGGGGTNAVDRMVAEGIDGVLFVAVNTDLQALRHTQAGTRLRIGDKLTRGLGSGGDAAMGRQAAEENLHDIYDVLRGTDLVFIAGGMGGGTGTGAAPVIARVAREVGALTVGVVTRPFSFEGNRRQQVAAEGIAALRAVVDTLVIIPNDRLLHAAGRSTPITDAFALADAMLRQGVQGIADIITKRGLINVDFNDVRAIMTRAGTAWMAIGEGFGEQRVVQAVSRAMNSPLLEASIDGARGLLFNVSGGDDLGLLEVREAADIVAQVIDPEANIIFGAVIDPSMPAGMVRVTFIATGFDPASKQVADTAVVTSLRSLTPTPTNVQASANSRVSPRATALPSVRADDPLDTLIPPFLQLRRR